MNAGEVVTSFLANVTGFISPLQAAQRAAQTFQKSVQSHAAAVNTSMTANLTKSSNAVLTWGNNVLKSTSKAGSSLLSFGKSVVSGVGHLGLYYYGAMQLASGVASMAGAFFSGNAAIEQSTVAFKGLLGSSKAADKMIRDLQAFAAKTPFEFPDLVKDTQMLLGMGVAAKDIIPEMTGIGDAVAAMGGGAEQVNQVTRALGQMQAKGKISGEEMMQLNEGGINGYKLLAQSMHLTVAQVQDLGQKGKLGTDAIRLLWQAMEKTYGGQMANQATTFNGLMSTLHDNALMAWNAFTGGAFTMAKQGLMSITDLMGSPNITAFAKTMGDKVGAGIATAVKWITDFYNKLANSGAFSTFAQIARDLGDILSNVVNTALAIFGQNITGIQEGMPTAAQSAQGVADSIKQIADATKSVTEKVAAITKAFSDEGTQGELLRGTLVGVAAALLAIKVINIAAPIIQGTIAAVAGAGGWIAYAGAAWSAAAGVIAATWPILLIVAAVALLAAGIYLLIKNWGAVSTFLQTVWGAVVTWLIGTLTSIGQWFSTVWNSIITFLHTVISGIVGWIGQRFTDFYNAVIAPLMPMINWFGSLFTAIWLIISTIVSRIGTWIGQQFQLIWQKIVVVWTAIQNVFNVVWGFIWAIIGKYVMQIWNTLNSAWNTIKSTVSTVWNWISSFIGGIWNTIWTKVKDFAGRIWDTIKTVFNSVKNTVSDIWRGLVNSMIDRINFGIGALRGFLNGIADAVNNVMGALGISGHRVGHVDSWLRNIPHLAQGNQNFGGGLAVVGEQGRELVSLPKGSAVLKHSDTEDVLRHGMTLPIPGFTRQIPGFAGGVGNFFASVFGNIGNVFSHLGNIGSWVIDNIKGLTGGFSLPGIFSAIPSALINLIGPAISSFISKLMPTVSNLNLPLANIGGFLLPAITAMFHNAMNYGIHQGIDFAFGQGSMLREAIGGRVVGAGWWPWGGEVDVALSDGLIERYLHLSAIFVKVGQAITRGAIIGLTGGGTPASGLGYWSSGAHLHYQIDAGNINAGINPLSVLAAYGITRPFAKGGIISEPIFGVGMRSGAGYSFGESGPETVIPGRPGGRSMVDILERIERRLDSGGPIPEYQVIQALGKLLGSGVR